jgi:hypothetical protein
MSAHQARRKTKADGRVPAGLKAMVVVPIRWEWSMNSGPLAAPEPGPAEALGHPARLGG